MMATYTVKWYVATGPEGGTPFQSGVALEDAKRAVDNVRSGPDGRSGVLQSVVVLDDETAGTVYQWERHGGVVVDWPTE
jgi:hypothetical protein